MTLTDKQQKVLALVTEAHGDQVLKYTGEPYVEHLLTVASAADREGITCGWEIGLCHDLIEDTNYDWIRLTHELIRVIEYGVVKSHAIADGVEYLTDIYTHKEYSNHNRKERKILEAKRLWHIPPEMQTIKYHDLIDNTSSIVAHDTGFARVYLEEKEYILQGMNKGNWRTYQEVCDTLEFAKFGLSLK